MHSSTWLAETPCGAVKLTGDGCFAIQLGRLPAAIDALTFTLAIDGAGTIRRALVLSFYQRRAHGDHHITDGLSAGGVVVS